MRTAFAIIGINVVATHGGAVGMTKERVQRLRINGQISLPRPTAPVPAYRPTTSPLPESATTAMRLCPLARDVRPRQAPAARKCRWTAVERASA